MKHLPYNTGKVLIGCRYTPPPPRYYFSADEDRLQRALIGGKKHVPADYWFGLILAIVFSLGGLVMVVR